MSVEDERVIADLEAQALGDRVLPLLDAPVHELFHFAAVHTHDMVVMCALIELEYGHSAFKMMAGNEAGRLELGKDSVHRGEPDIFIRHQELLVDILGAHMTDAVVGQDVEDFQARQRDLEAGIAQIVTLVGRGWLEAVRHAWQPGMIGLDYQSFNGSAPY